MITAFALLLLIALPTKSIGKVTYNLVRTMITDTSDFNHSLQELGFNDYITPYDITSKPGKNIIIISMESLELGFVDNYPELTPNLNKLSKSWTFYNDMPQALGASWTAGSMYAVQTGLPAIFGMQGNNIFQNVTDKKITTLGDVLNRSGYSVNYIMGNISFAGSSDFLKLSAINTIDQNNSLGKYPKHPWGLGDLDVFNEAKLQINKADKSDKPFALFLSTINGHAPNGIYDARMTKFIDNKSRDVTFSVQALDFLIGDFLNFLQEKNLLENTSIFIFPDHMMMGNNEILSTFTKSGKSYRGLFFITNESSNKLNKAADSVLYQYEIPRLIIKGAGIDTNAKFASDYIDSNMIDFMKNNQSKIVALNVSGFDKKSYSDGLDIMISDNTLILAADNFTDKIDITTLNGHGFVEVALDRFMSKRLHSINNDVNLEFIPFALRVIINENKVNTVYIGDKNKLGIVKSGKSVHFTKDEMKSITSGLDMKVSTHSIPKVKQA